MEDGREERTAHKQAAKQEKEQQNKRRSNNLAGDFGAKCEKASDGRGFSIPLTVRCIRAGGAGRKNIMILIMILIKAKVESCAETNGGCAEHQRRLPVNFLFTLLPCGANYL